MKIRDNPEGSAGQETQDSFIFFSFFSFWPISQFFLTIQDLT